MLCPLRALKHAVSPLCPQACCVPSVPSTMLCPLRALNHAVSTPCPQACCVPSVPSTMLCPLCALNHAVSPLCPQPCFASLCLLNHAVLQLLSPNFSVKDYTRSATPNRSNQQSFATVLREMAEAALEPVPQPEPAITRPGGFDLDSDVLTGYCTGYIVQHRRMPMPSRPPPGSRIQPKVPCAILWPLAC